MSVFDNLCTLETHFCNGIQQNGKRHIAPHSTDSMRVIIL